MIVRSAEHAEQLRVMILGFVEHKPAPGRDPCWVPRRPIARSGYCHISTKGRIHYVHRIAYEAFVGPIDPGLVIDHMCRNRACCNPAHLRMITLKQNSAERAKAYQTHCAKGHVWTDETTRWHERTRATWDGNVVSVRYRQCRVCDRGRVLKRKLLKTVDRCV